MRRKRMASFCVVAAVIVLLAVLSVTGLPVGIYDINSLPSMVRQGLEFQGGLSALYKAELPDDSGADFDQAMNDTLLRLRARLAAEGYVGAAVTREGVDKIRVEVSADQDTNRLLDLLSTTGRLEIRDPDGEVVITGGHIEDAFATMDQSGQYVVAFKLNPEGTALFEQATRDNVGKYISIYLDDELISSPTVQNAITEGTGVIQVDSLESAQSMASIILGGALPLNLQQQSSRAIGATLGENALSSTALAAVIGLAALMIFLIVIYRIPGAVTSLSLVLYAMLLLFVMATIDGVQLTLPALAGILLGLGLALSGIILVFERFREELRAGKSLPTAWRNGFSGAVPSILDTHIAAAVAGFALLFLLTGNMRGFAVMLLLCIAVSLFTVLVVIRFMVQWAMAFNVNNVRWYARRTDKEPRIKVGLFKKGLYKKSWMGATALVAAGLLVAVLLGVNWGIDFGGGTLAVVDFGVEYRQADLEKALRDSGISQANIVASSVNAGGAQTQAHVRMGRTLSEQETDSLQTEIEETLKEQYGYDKVRITSFESIGAAISGNVLRGAVLPALAAIILMLLYVWLRFELPSGISAVAALLAAAILTLAVAAVSAMAVNLPFVAAVLVAAGYAAVCTVIIFTRIRQQVKRSRAHKVSREETAETSVDDTIGRIMLITLAALIMPIALLALGTPSIRAFALPVILGLLLGALCGVCFAPVLWCKLADLLEKYKATSDA
ncbi:MAG: protein translocase subunit SecF, partial [Christensenellales bacterium]